jgi:hypothetical protein
MGKGKGKNRSGIRDYHFSPDICNESHQNMVLPKAKALGILNFED